MLSNQMRLFSTATTAFQDTCTEVRITTEGRSYLGSPNSMHRNQRAHTPLYLGESNRMDTGTGDPCYILQDPTSCCRVYSALTHSLTSKGAYSSRTTPNIGPMLLPLETTIRSIPTLTNRPPITRENLLPCQPGMEALAGQIWQDGRPSLDSQGIHRATMALASEKGASSWLTTLPIEEHGFTLHKGAFHRT